MFLRDLIAKPIIAVLGTLTLGITNLEAKKILADLKK